MDMPVQAYVLLFSSINFIFFFVNIHMLMRNNKLREELVNSLKNRKSERTSKVLRFRKGRLWRIK